MFSDCTLNRFFLRIILTDGDPANLSSNPSFPSSFFFFLLQAPHLPSSLSICFHPLACLYVNLTKFTHFPWKSSRIWSDMNCIKKGIQMHCDSRGLYAATGITINSFSVLRMSGQLGIAELIRIKISYRQKTKTT